MPVYVHKAAGRQTFTEYLAGSQLSAGNVICGRELWV
jgi:hypothetical protein